MEDKEDNQEETAGRMEDKEVYEDNQEEIAGRMEDKEV